MYKACAYAHVYVTVHAFIINYTIQHISGANKHGQTVVLKLQLPRLLSVCDYQPQRHSLFTNTATHSLPFT